MRLSLSLNVVIALGLSPAVSFAQAFHATGPAAGWTCMSLNLTEQQALDPAVHVLVRQQPSESAPVAGWAPITVAIRDPNRPTNGFAEILRPNGQHVWIPEASLRAWSSKADPTAKCVPSIMSNGTYGFAYPH